MIDETDCARRLRHLAGVRPACDRAPLLRRRTPKVDLTKWTAPDIASVGDDPFGKLVKYGYALIGDTANQIGPNAEDPAKRLTGNNLNCQSCHLDAGTRPYAMPLTGIWGQFPQYRGREGAVDTLEVRINGCMERSMDGRALPPEGREMVAMLAYMRWLSGGIPAGATLIGAGTMRIKEPARAADPAHGAQVYADTCAACHGADGSGSAPRRAPAISSRRCGGRTVSTTAPG